MDTIVIKHIQSSEFSILFDGVDYPEIRNAIAEISVVPDGTVTLVNLQLVVEKGVTIDNVPHQPLATLTTSTPDTVHPALDDK